MEPNQIRLVNLNWKATQEQISEWVSTFAKVKDCRLIMDYRKRSKGLCYITLEDERSLEAALAKNEEEFMERKIRITKAKPPSERKPKAEKTEKKEKTEKTKKKSEKTDEE